MPLRKLIDKELQEGALVVEELVKRVLKKCNILCSFYREQSEV